jgi:hypothetical protein
MGYRRKRSSAERRERRSTAHWAARRRPKGSWVCQRCVPAGREFDGAGGAAQDALGLGLDANQLDDGLAGLGDDDLLALKRALDEAGEVGLGL